MLASYLSNRRDLFTCADKVLRALIGLGQAPGSSSWATSVSTRRPACE